MTNPTERDVIRKRKPHKKSRRGCRNCKLRSVKCDETRPRCAKCCSYGVVCNYDMKVPDLQMSFNAEANAQPNKKSHQIAVRKSHVPNYLAPIIVVCDGTYSLQLDSSCLGRIERFQKRTVLTLGTPTTAVLYKDVILEFAFRNPYLMHIVQTLTARHDRLLSNDIRPFLSTTEIYHWHEAARLFNQKLSLPLETNDLDPLWAAAAMLGAMAISSIEASCAEEAWPFKSSDSSDLEWLKLSDGKRAIWEIANPLRPDSAFRTLNEEFQRINLSVNTPRSGPELQGIPPEFIPLYNLDGIEPSENKYYVAVHTLAPLLNIECDRENIVQFLAFMNKKEERFTCLLAEKDPRALLLLAYWYSKVCRAVWWVSRRATLECQSICLYLERYYSSNTAIQKLLEFPKLRCGLLAVNSEKYSSEHI